MSYKHIMANKILLKAICKSFCVCSYSDRLNKKLKVDSAMFALSHSEEVRKGKKIISLINYEI